METERSEILECDILSVASVKACVVRTNLIKGENKKQFGLRALQRVV